MGSDRVLRWLVPVLACALAVGALGSGAQPAAARADSAPHALTATSRGGVFSMQVSPARFAFPAYWQSRDASYTVSNLGTIPLHVTTQLLDVAHQAANGSISYRPPQPGSATGWVKLSPAVFDLASGQRQRVLVHLAMPARPEPGDHNIGVIFHVPAHDPVHNIVLDRAIATPMLIDVPGPQIKRASIGPLRSQSVLSRGPLSVVGDGQVDLRLPVRNLGNVHRSYSGRSQDLRATTSTGARLSYDDFTVLRGSSQDVDLRWQQPPVACVCQVTVTTDDGRGKRLVASRQLVIIPMRLVGGVAAVTLGLWLLLAQLRRRLRVTVRRRGRS